MRRIATRVLGVLLVLACVAAALPARASRACAMKSCCAAKQSPDGATRVRGERPCCRATVAVERATSAPSRIEPRGDRTIAFAPNAIAIARDSQVLITRAPIAPPPTRPPLYASYCARRC